MGLQDRQGHLVVIFIVTAGALSALCLLDGDDLHKGLVGRPRAVENPNVQGQPSGPHRAGGAGGAGGGGHVGLLSNEEGLPPLRAPRPSCWR